MKRDRAHATNRPTSPHAARAVLRLVLILGVGLWAYPSNARSDGDERPSWYTQALARGEAGLNVTYLWSLGAKFRAETVVGGHKIVTIVSGDTYYAFDALAMNGISIVRSPRAVAADDNSTRPFGREVETLTLQGAEKIREEVILGVNCSVYQVSDSAGRRVLWATADDRNLPVRIEIYSRRSGKTKFTDFIDWMSGIPIKDVFFVPNPAIQFEHFELDEYMRRTAELGPIGSVPVLYSDLLHGRRERKGD